MPVRDSFTCAADIAPITIASGASLSNPIDLKGLRLFAIAMPPAWTAANLTFQASPDAGSTWLDLNDQNGGALTAVAAASTCISLSPAVLSAYQHIRVRSGTASTPVTQGAERTLQLILRGI
jgi:hypothetical protein